jgi:hypothetical protein
LPYFPHAALAARCFPIISLKRQCILSKHRR